MHIRVKKQKGLVGLGISKIFKDKKWMLISLIIGGVIMALLSLDQRVVFINLTGSLPRGIYVAVPYTSIRSDDIVAYRPPEDVMKFAFDRGYAPFPDMTFMKKVAAVSGDFYSVSMDLDFKVNGKSLGKAYRLDRLDREMPLQMGLHMVPDGHFLPYGTADRSLDGRYFGTVSQDRVIAKVIPLAVEFW